MMKNKVVIQTGFAENFKTHIQNAIQSSYWASKQVTIFIVCVWEQNDCHSLDMLGLSLSQQICNGYFYTHDINILQDS